MPQIDICLSSTVNEMGAQVLLTVTDATDAQAICDSINASTIYQQEHLLAWMRETIRDEPASTGPAQGAIGAEPGEG